MQLPIRPLRGRWPATLEGARPLRRYFRIDPRTLLEPDASAQHFREAMASVYVGGTIKITGAGRHPEADQLLLDHVDLTGAWIVDLGASDGSTSTELIRRLPEFARFTLADRYLTLDAVSTGRRTVFFDNEGAAVLVAGPRCAGWPSLSPTIARLYGPVTRRAARHGGEARRVLLLNPEFRRLMAQDPRVDTRQHDVFAPWQGPRPDVIKVANLLRRLYFTDEQLLDALIALRESLPVGGHLMLVDNPRLKNTPPRAGIWRRDQGRFVEVARTGEPEIADLVEQVGRTSSVASSGTVRDQQETAIREVV